MVNPPKFFKLKKRKNGTSVTVPLKNMETTKNGNKRKKERNVYSDTKVLGGGRYKYSFQERAKMQKKKKARYSEMLRNDREGPRVIDKRKMFGSRIGSKRGVRYAKSGREDDYDVSEKMKKRKETKKEDDQPKNEQDKGSS